MCIKVSKKLSISTWNVNGLYKRVGGDRISKLDDENLSKIMCSDIVTLSETHASSSETLAYDNFKCYVNCRQSSSKKVGGGLATFIKKDIVSGVKLLDKSMSEIMWFKLDKHFFRYEKDLYLCFIYIPPSNSSYTLRTGCDKQIFEKLDHDVSKYSCHGDIIIMGDLNSHINKNELDFITNEVDDNLDDFLPVNYVADSVQKIRNTEVAQSTNGYGKLVIDLCSEAQLRILNGRTLGDSRGKITFLNHNGTSIDDYCICSSEFLPNIVKFNVGDFEPTISDHRPITVNILSQFRKDFLHDLKTPLKKLNWTKIREDNFKQNFVNCDFQEVFNDFDNMDNMLLSDSTDTVSNSITCTINTVVNKISKVLYNSACLGSKDTTKKKSKKRKVKKKYYDSECESKYRSLKSMSRKLCNEPWNKSLRLDVLSCKI